uniref:26S proteasome non-ATPase regulatory subunit 5 n=1 Tax=Glossina morsitans morsitans TaxID=37546 RepID=D3TQ34_GLOMM
MSEEWFSQKLESLKINTDNRLSTLSEIRGRLNVTPNLEVRITNRLLSSPEIYDCLEEEGAGRDKAKYRENCGETQRLDLVSDILSICMANLTLRQNDFPLLLQRALEHKKARIRALALNTILKELQNQVNLNGKDGQSVGDLLSDELLQHVLKGLQDIETEVGNPALSILLMVLENHLHQPWVKESLTIALNKDGIVKCRTYELAVGLAKRSPITLEKVEFIVDHALAELDNDDILMQVNILEILVSLAEQNHGLLYLEKHQVYDIICKRVDSEDNPLDRLLVPGIMKFFGKTARVQPQKIITGYPHMIRCLFECLHRGDIANLPTAFDTLANLAHTQQGVSLLELNYKTALKEIFEDYHSYLHSLASDLKIRAFNSLEAIFTFEQSVCLEVNSILHTWFSYVGRHSDNMEFLLDYCRNPFPDIKISSLNFIRALCCFEWGVEALKNTAGLLEFLLDRKIEFDKEAKYAKYCVIELLADSNAFDVQTNLQLRNYVNEGPYYVQNLLDVAVEGN